MLPIKGVVLPMLQYPLASQARPAAGASCLARQAKRRRRQARQALCFARMLPAAALLLLGCCQASQSTHAWHGRWRGGEGWSNADLAT